MTDERDPQAAGERAYFRLPAQGWRDVRLPIEARLREVDRRLRAALDDHADEADVPSPAELALELGGAATAIFELLAPEERELRELITTLRTGLALCWDMYSYQEAGKVSVQAHMDRLKTEIEGFEAQLEDVQSGRGGNDS